MNEAGRSLTLVAATFVALLALMAWGFDLLFERADQPNRDIAAGASGPRVVELEVNRAGQYLVPGEINGEAVNFLVDTGATHVAVPGHVADRAGLPRLGDIAVETAGGRTRASRTVIDRLAVGGIVRRDVRGSINPSMSGDYVLLGMTFLRHLDLRQEGDRLILRESAR
ncbi:MAG: TIGR02281 family clan AA aspartic protease [Halofilum sp. (in: g-proteobacteria)]